MMLKRIYEDSSLVSMFAVINEEISFKGIAIRITGTNTATAATLNDVGRIQYIKNGISIVDANFEFLSALNNIIGGFPNNTSTSSGALDFYVYIPRRYLDDNVEHVIPADNAQIKCTFGANLNTRVASAGKVEVYLDLEKGTQKYDLLIREYSDSVAAASTRPIAIDQPNIIMVLLSQILSSVLTLSSTTYTQTITEIGGISADASIGALTDNTQDQFNLEASWVLACVPYVANGDITSRLFDNVRLLLTTNAAASIEVLVLSASFNDERHAASVNKQRARMLDITQRKAQRGDTATIKTIQQVAAAQ